MRTGLQQLTGEIARWLQSIPPGRMRKDKFFCEVNNRVWDQLSLDFVGKSPVKIDPAYLYRNPTMNIMGVSVTPSHRVAENVVAVYERVSRNSWQLIDLLKLWEEGKPRG